MLRRLLKLLRNPQYYFLGRLSKHLDQYSAQKKIDRNETLMSHLRHCGIGVRFNGHITLTGLENIVIGDNVHIGDNALIQGDGGLEIGDNTHISRNLVLYTMNHDYSGSRLPYDEKNVKKPVRIGRNVWIGVNVCIVPGTVIGDGAIIGVGTILFGNVPPLAIVGSSPWRQIGTRDSVHYARLNKSQLYGGISGRPFKPGGSHID